MKEYLEKESKDIKRKFFTKKLYASLFILLGIAMCTLAVKSDGWVMKFVFFLIGLVYIVYGGHDLYNIIQDEKEFKESEKKYQEGIIKADLLTKFNEQEFPIYKPEEEKTDLKPVKKKKSKKKKEEISS